MMCLFFNTPPLRHPVDISISCAGVNLGGNVGKYGRRNGVRKVLCYGAQSRVYWHWVPCHYIPVVSMFTLNLYPDSSCCVKRLSGGCYRVQSIVVTSFVKVWPPPKSKVVLSMNGLVAQHQSLTAVPPLPRGALSAEWLGLLLVRNLSSASA